MKKVESKDGNLLRPHHLISPLLRNQEARSTLDDGIPVFLGMTTQLVKGMRLKAQGSFGALFRAGPLALLRGLRPA